MFISWSYMFVSRIIENFIKIFLVLSSIKYIAKHVKFQDTQIVESLTISL